MKVVVTNLYDETVRTVEGDPVHVEHELLRMFPWLRSENPEHHGDVAALVDHVNSMQAFDAEIVDHGVTHLQKAEPGNLGDDSHVVQAMLGHHSQLHQYLEAAKFLVGGAPLGPEKARQALWAADGDAEEAALGAYGLEPSEANLKALRAVCGIVRTKKAEDPAVAQNVEPGHPDAQEAAEQVGRAFADGFVLPVKLGGRHSAGSLLARDQDSGTTWLLKPGAGGQTPAAGAQEEQASQARREAAFWHTADAWHLGDYLPRADLVLVDGKEYAALKLLPWAYRGLDKLQKEHAGVGRTVLAPYLKDGVLHRWGVLDFVLGNPDRHAGNLMVHDRDVQLIDHGSAMAGEAFDPAHDQYSFTPFYLRAWAPGKFNALSPEQKLHDMPRLSPEAAAQLRGWLDGLHGEDLDKVLQRYGVDPQPARTRLAMLKTLALQGPADLAVNQAWVEQ